MPDQALQKAKFEPLRLPAHQPVGCRSRPSGRMAWGDLQRRLEAGPPAGGGAAQCGHAPGLADTACEIPGTYAGAEGLERADWWKLRRRLYWACPGLRVAGEVHPFTYRAVDGASRRLVLIGKGVTSSGGYTSKGDRCSRSR